LTIIPAVKAVINDAAIRKRANIQPSKEYVIKKLSAPTWGVAIRNDMVAPFDAPLFLREAATGTAPHEQRGSGIPNIVDLTTRIEGTASQVTANDGFGEENVQYSCYDKTEQKINCCFIKKEKNFF